MHKPNFYFGYSGQNHPKAILLRKKLESATPVCKWALTAPPLRSFICWTVAADNINHR